MQNSVETIVVQAAIVTLEYPSWPNDSYTSMVSSMTMSVLTTSADTYFSTIVIFNIFGMDSEYTRRLPRYQRTRGNEGSG